jgi:hypothetical protein
MNDQISIDINFLIEKLHKRIREALEKQFDGEWRIIKIEAQSSREYSATLKTRKSKNPEYIPCQMLASFTIHAIENGPLEANNLEELLLLPKSHLVFIADLLANGNLYIVDKLERLEEIL